MLRSYRLLAKSRQNHANKFDWTPFREEVYGKRLKPDPSVEPPRRQHTFVPERESDEVAKRPMLVLPGKAAVAFFSSSHAKRPQWLTARTFEWLRR
jgi:hypothetical protein